ncbi:ABC transporter ATP-binding protein [Intestinimonas massiliensis (ex Afouda et al. 2020)]|uniref:ABC transporter ATP-binding protein n=1 Tax=Intestinimonas massiliensis (ex Afouda et al. 2020) TaxID=1673721 RepID=UPI0013EF21E8|nr:ABC transporter ATP-binding protein [Intestinimonas massiliensis (ex Afouda et al. 2020)]
MIRVSDLNFSYADKCVLQQVSFNVDDGDLFAILGPNAAGKTTLIKLLTGILEMQGGNIIFDDMPLNGTNDYKIRSMIGVMQEITGVHLKMTGFEYLCLIAALNNYPPDMITERVLFIANKFNFESELHRSIKKYSAGTKKKIEFCAAIVHEPRVLLLDEPFESVDPIVCFEIKQHLKHLVEHGSTVIITSHILETIQNLCNKYIIINQGSVVRCGNIEKDNGVDLEQIFIEVVGHEAAE